MHGYPRIISTKLLLDPKMQELSLAAMHFYTWSATYADFDGRVTQPLPVIAAAIFPKLKNAHSLASRALTECEKTGLIKKEKVGFFMPRLREESPLEYRRKSDVSLSDATSSLPLDAALMPSRLHLDDTLITPRLPLDDSVPEYIQELSESFSQKLPLKEEEEVKDEIKRGEKGELVVSLPPLKLNKKKSQEIALQSYAQFEERYSGECSEVREPIISLLKELAVDLGYARIEKEAERLASKIVETWGNGESFGEWLDMRLKKKITGAELHRAIWLEVKGR